MHNTLCSLIFTTSYSSHPGISCSIPSTTTSNPSLRNPLIFFLTSSSFVAPNSPSITTPIYLASNLTLFNSFLTSQLKNSSSSCDDLTGIFTLLIVIPSSFHFFCFLITSLITPIPNLLSILFLLGTGPYSLIHTSSLPPLTFTNLASDESI